MMGDLPFDIPKSLASYAEQFEDEPDKMTQKLEKHLQKRGPDAVGYFLLAWFYHVKGIKDKAIQTALQAKICAPGSPLMNKLHYYLAHPDAFEAWTPDTGMSQTAQKYRSDKGPEPVMDLDNLIARLSEVDSKPISIAEKDAQKKEIDSPDDRDIEGDQADDIASETLAKIHETQGKYDQAIQTYQKMKSQKQEKSDYFEEQIQRLEKKKAEENSDQDDQE